MYKFANNSPIYINLELYNQKKRHKEELHGRTNISNTFEAFPVKLAEIFFIFNQICSLSANNYVAVAVILKKINKHTQSNINTLIQNK